MMQIDFEKAYNNSARVPEIVSIAPRWLAESVALRERVKGDLNLSYGPHERHRYDIFWPDQRTASTPIAVFIHGGYWQSRDRRDFSFTAAGLLSHGVAYAMPSYRLAPEVRIADIIDDMKLFLAALWRQTGQRPVVTGHSAGGHLTGALLATDWSKAAGVPADLVRAGYAISGVFDVRPLVTTSINKALKEDEVTAQAVSPLLGPLPPKGHWLTAAVGGDESAEFIRQSSEIARVWSAAGRQAECVIVPGTNHFTVIDALADPNSAMVHRIAALARHCASA